VLPAQRVRIGEAPDTSGLVCDAITRDGRPYLERYHLVQSPAGGVRFHHFRADDPAHLHDHPWDSVSLLLAGTVAEHTAEAVTVWRPGDLVTRPAERAHRLELLDGEAWSYFTTGPLARRWGFHVDGRWVHWRDYPGAGDYVDVDVDAGGSVW
jgi:quercetin dioxygenase-like cupin family protein